MKTILLKILSFCAILCICLTVIFRVLWLWDDGYSTQVFEEFYAMPKTTVDAVYIGTSGAKEYYNSSVGFFKNGVACYNLSTSNQSFTCAKYLIKEALKTQTPQLFLIEMRGLLEVKIFDADIRKTTDAMLPSRNRNELIDALLLQRVTAFPDEHPNKWDYYFSWTTYHSRWEEITNDDFHQGQVVFGCPYYTQIEDEIDLENFYTAEEVPLEPYNEAILRDLLEYCKTLDQQVVFVLSPTVFDSPEKLGQLLYAGRIIEEAGFTFWNQNTEEAVSQIGLDYDLDFKNPGHVNSYGALKVTAYMAQIMQEQYGLPDRRSESAYKRWKSAYMEFLTHLAEITTNEAHQQFLMEYVNG